MLQERLPGLQTVIGIAMLCIVLISSLALGANRPISWILLFLAIGGIFAAQLLLGLINTVPMQAKRLWLPIVLYIAVLIWGFVQLMPGLSPELAHPVWATVPDAAPRIGADPGNGQHILLRLALYGMIFWIALRTAVNTDRAAIMLKIVAIFGTALAVFSIYAMLAGNNPIVPDFLTGPVAQGPFANRNSYATYAIIGALANIAVVLDMGREAPNRRSLVRQLRDTLEFFFGGAWIYGIGTILCIGAVALTQSRGGGVAGVIGLIVLVAAWRGRGRRLDPVLMGTLGLVVVFVAATSATGFAERLLATAAEEGRFSVYPAILDGIADRPLLGHGIGSFWDAFRPYLPLEAALGEWDFAHNSYLQNAFEFGLPAAAAFYLAIGLLARRIWLATVRRRTDRAFACFALAVIAAAGFHSIFDFSLQMPATAALFAVVLGLGAGQAFSREEIKVSVLKTR